MGCQLCGCIRIVKFDSNHREMPGIHRLLTAALQSGGGDDGTSSLIHVILLLVICGVVVCSSLHVVQHKAGWTWLPEPAVTLLVGLAMGLVIRFNTDDEAQFPQELGFSGSIFFLVLLPIIIFEGGFSLKKKEFFGQIGSILVLSIVGTVISGLSIGGILYLVGERGWSHPLAANEALAYGSVLASTDSLAVTQQLSGLGIDRSFQALVYGEGSVNEAVALVMYDTFVHFIDDHGEDETTSYAFTRFFALFLGSICMGLAVGVLATWVFRLVHMDWRPDIANTVGDAVDFLCMRCCRNYNPDRDYAAARSALLRSNPIGPAAAAAAAAGHVKLAGSAPQLKLRYGHYPVTSGAGSPHPMAVQAAAIAAGLPPNFDPVAVVKKPPSLAALRVAAKLLPKEERMKYEPKPTSSVFLQTSFILAMGYISYMAAEACALSGVVSVLFCGVAMNHFVRPLLSREGKRFSEGTIKVLSQTSDTSIFFQVGLDMGLTVATNRGIDTGKDGALLGWVIFSILVGRAVTVLALSVLVNYYRRSPIPWQYLVALWHCGMRGAGTYAFTIIFPTDNRDVLLDVTAATMLFTVFALGGTTVPLLRWLGIPHDPPGAHGHGHGDEDGEHADGHKPGHQGLIGHGMLIADGSESYANVLAGHIQGVEDSGAAGPSLLGPGGLGGLGSGGRTGYTAIGPGPTTSSAAVAAAPAANPVIAKLPAGMASPRPPLERTRSGYQLEAHGTDDTDSDDEHNSAKDSSRGRSRGRSRANSSGSAPGSPPMKSGLGAGNANAIPSLSLHRTNSRSGLRSPTRTSHRSARAKDNGVAVLLTGDVESFQQADEGQDGHADASDKSSASEATGAAAALEHATVTVAVGLAGETYAYRTVMIGGARAYVPVFREATTSEKAVSAVNSFLSMLRYYVSGVLRDDKPL